MRILLVEDKDSFRKMLVQALDGRYQVTASADPREALQALSLEAFDVLVTDLRLPAMSGLELLKAAKRLRPAMRAVVMSAFGETRDIVEAIRWGADDFLAKPFDLDAFAAVLERLRALGAAPPPDPREPWIVHAPAMAEFERTLAKAAETSLPVLFHGEEGSGKARAARRLHTLRHPQAPFAHLPAASLGPRPRELELARGGSLFLSGLDQLADPGPLLEAMDAPGASEVAWMGSCRELSVLREDLRLRMGVLTLRVPPLRERREDILPLLRAFLDMHARREGRPVPVVERSQEREILQRAWPGNVRQLSWSLAQALGATGGPVLAALPPEGARLGEAMVLPFPEPGTLETMLASASFHACGALLRRALEGRREDPAGVARDLGMTPRALARVLREHGIPLEDD